MRLTTWRGQLKWLAAWLLISTVLVALYALSLTQQPVWQLEEAIEAPLGTTTIELKGSRVIEQDVKLSTGRADAIAFKVGTLNEVAATLTLTQGEQVIIEQRPDTGVTQLATFPISNTTDVPAGQWLVFRGLGQQVDPNRPVTIKLEATAGSTAVAYEIDDTRYPDANLKLDGQPRDGTLGFAVLSQVTWLETLRYHVLVRDQLVYAVLLALAAAIGVLAWQAVRHREISLPLLLITIAGAYTLPLYLDSHNWGVWDWPEAASYYAAARHSLAAGQFPFWNPYFCGGTPMWHDPQTYWFSGTFLFVLLFGAIVGTKLAITAYITLTLSGMYLLTRALRASRPAALLAAVIFSCSGFVASHLAAGQMLWLTVAWIPWTVFFFLKALTKPWYLLAAVAVYLIPFFEGRVHVTVYLTLLLLTLIPGLLLRGVSWRILVRRFALFAVLVLGLGAIKILPMTVYLQQVAGTLEQKPAIPITQLVSTLTTREAALDFSVPWIGAATWHEYAAYIGFLPLLLAVIGIGIALRRRRHNLIIILPALLLFLLLATDLGASNPLAHVPVLEQLHNPARAMVIVVFVLAVCAAVGLDQLTTRLRQPSLRRAVALVIALLVFVDLALIARQPFADLYALPTRQFIDHAAFRQVAGHADNGLHIVQAGYGAVDYCPPHTRLWHGDKHVEASNSESYRGEAYARQGTAEVKHVNVTPNIITITLGSISQPDDIVINQTYDVGWTSHEHVVKGHDNKIAVAVTPIDTNTQLNLSYRPPWWFVGAAVTILTILGISGVAALQWYRSRRKSV